jgi:xylulokinase
MRDLVAGVDSSTQSCTIVARRLTDGAVVAQARAPHPPTTPPRSEQWPEKWWAAFRNALTQLGRDVVARIGAISVGSQGHGLVLLDAGGSALLKAKLWNDTEAAPDAEALLALRPAEDWARRTGSIPAPAMTIAKLAWARRNHPDILPRIHRFQLPANYLGYRLTGRSFTERGLATGSGIFDPYRDAWDLELAAVAAPDLDWAAILPDVVASDAVGGEVKADLCSPGAEVLADIAGCVVAAGSGDNMTAALGMGVSEGDVVLSLGTSGTAYGVSKRPVADARGAINGFADAEDGFMPMVTTLNAAKVTDAVRRLLGVTPDEFDALALSEAATVGEVALLPYLDGERTPNLPEATGSLLGLRSDVTQAQVARAAVDGVVCGLLDGVDVLASLGLPQDGRLIVTGGASVSAAYRQAVADLSGRAVWAATAVEAAAEGAAIQAAAAWTARPIREFVEAWAPELQLVAEPDPALAERSREVRERHRALLARLHGPQAAPMAAPLAGLRPAEHGNGRVPPTGGSGFPISDMGGV